jgi:multiple antibiotic resistance protein
MPLVAGPSTIAILLLLASTEPARIWEWCTALVIAWAATTLLLTASPFLMRALGARGLRALERLMGMLLVLLATQMLLNGVRDFVESLGA